VAEGLLSPTRAYAPVLKLIMQRLGSEVHAAIHCSGGGQTKILRFGSGKHYIKDNLFPAPPHFQRDPAMRRRAVAGDVLGIQPGAPHGAGLSGAVPCGRGGNRARLLRLRLGQWVMSAALKDQPADPEVGGVGIRVSLSGFVLLKTGFVESSASVCVYLMCGRAGSGKTTLAAIIEKERGPCASAR